MFYICDRGSLQSERGPARGLGWRTRGAPGRSILARMRQSRPWAPVPTGAPPTRASDAQRAAVWALLDAAASEGRLDPLEHHERTRAVPGAVYVDELRPLIADLHGGDRELGLPTAPPRGVAGRSRRGRTGEWRRAVAGAAFVAVGVAAAALIASSAPTDLLTPDAVTDLIHEARDEAPDARVRYLEIRPDMAVLTVEDPDAPGDALTRTYDDAWSGTTPVPGLSGRPTTGVVDIEPSVVVGAIESAPGALGLAGVKVTSVTVSADPGGFPEYKVTVSDGDRTDSAVFGPDGRLRTLRTDE